MNETTIPASTPPERWGPYYLHPDGFYRLCPPGEDLGSGFLDAPPAYIESPDGME